MAVSGNIKNKTGFRPFQDCCKNWSLNSDFYFCGCKKGCYGYYIIQSSNCQKLIEEKRLSKCAVVIFIKHLNILNNKESGGWVGGWG